MRRFWSAEGEFLVGHEVSLDPSRSHHLLRVTGIGPGEQVELFDGQGARCRACFLRVEAGRAVLQVRANVPVEPLPSTWLLAAITRGAAFDLTVRMATELGVTELQPVLAQRSVARGDRRARWERIAKAASTQSGRSELPSIHAPLPLSDALECVPGDVSRLLCVPGGAVRRRPAAKVAVAIGPEGGWTQDEIEVALDHGCELAGLGTGVLRADTAAAAALALLLV